MRRKTSIVAVLISVSLAGCGGGGSDTAVSANPPATDDGPAPGPAPGPVPAPRVDRTPISAPSPSPGKVPAPLPDPPPAPAGLQFSGAAIRHALKQPIPAAGGPGSHETGQYVHDGLDNPIAAYIASDGNTIRTRTLSPNEAGSYTPSREAAVTLAETGSGLVPIVDGVQYQGTPLNFNLNYPANQTAGMWVSATGSPYFVKLIPSTLAANPAVMKLCWHINTAAAVRLACTYHHADGRIFGSNFIEDIDGVVSNFAWQWEATARPDGRAYTLADFSPGAIGGIAAMPMSCLTRYIGPGNPVEPTTTRQVQMTPSELRIGDEVLFRHGLGQSTVQASADSVTYTHTDFNPVASFTREYTLRAGLLLSVRWSVVAGGSGSASECVKP